MKVEYDAFAVGHSFDCLPAHESISHRGVASTRALAVARAVRKVMSDRRLSHRQLESLKLSIVISKAVQS